MLKRDFLMLLIRKFTEAIAHVNELIESGNLNEAEAFFKAEWNEDLVNRFLNNDLATIDNETKEHLYYQCELLYAKIKLRSKTGQDTSALRQLFVPLTQKALQIDDTVFNLSLAQKLANINTSK